MPATRLGRRIPALEPTSPVASRPGVSRVGKTPRPPGAFPVKSLSAMPLPTPSPLAVPIGTAIRRACRAPASDCSSRHRPVALPPTVRQAADRLRCPLPVSGGHASAEGGTATAETRDLGAAGTHWLRAGCSPPTWRTSPATDRHRPAWQPCAGAPASIGKARGRRGGNDGLSPGPPHKMRRSMLNAPPGRHRLRRIDHPHPVRLLAHWAP